MQYKNMKLWSFCCQRKMEMSPGKWYRVPSSPALNNDTELELAEDKGTELSIHCQLKSLLENRWTKPPKQTARTLSYFRIVLWHNILIFQEVIFIEVGIWEQIKIFWKSKLLFLTMPSTLRNATSCTSRLTFYFKLLCGGINTTTCSYIKNKSKSKILYHYKKLLKRSGFRSKHHYFYSIVDDIMMYYFISAQ